jgi:ribulose-5-phosphate 4-epimerase/fuculose-1-phosphate aldolase
MMMSLVEEHSEWVPILENSQDYVELSQAVGRVLTQHPQAHGFLLRRHGLYTWGEDLATAKRHVEIFEFLFEVVVESAIVGYRKPEPQIFQICCDQLGIAPAEAVFLDDLGANLKGARALGMHTIKVDDTLSAIDELETALGIPLPRG